MCMSPWRKNDIKNGQNYDLPCGKCPECSARRISAWSFRLMQQYKICDSAHFITLTYDTTHVPITKRGFMSLSKRDVQTFIKRLRKRTAGSAATNIKYYAAGEYGGRTRRPHYHIILFNARIELLQEAWNKGSLHYGTVNEASVGYTLKYISKPKNLWRHANDDRVPEFALMSKRLGANYLTDKAKNWHKADLENRMHLVIADGKKVSMPRYYKDKLYNEDERAKIAAAHVARLGKKLLQENLEAKRNPDYLHNKTQAIQAAFINQAEKAKKHDKL